MKGLIKRMFGDGSRGEISYDEAKELAGHKDETVRIELAERPDVRPEILYFLSEDKSPNVRRAIAKNKKAPHHADLILSKDSSQAVRETLADKIARVAPNLNADDKDKVKRMAYSALETLARDEVTHVRQVLAEALKDVAGAPPDVIRRLAFDTEIVVAGPILENSPVLSDADLIEIIEKGTATGRLSAISKRPTLSEDISESIVATADEEAVALLLANVSAQLRETTLDRIADQAKDIVSWHAPLVSRPTLSAYSVKRLSGFVATNFLRILSIRSDLEPDVLEAVKKSVAERIENGEEELLGVIETEDTQTPLEVAMQKVEKLRDKGDLTEARVKKFIGGDPDMVVAALAVLAEVPVLAVHKVTLTNNIKGIVAICWQAGLTAKTAERVQGAVLSIGDNEIMRADGGGYPMSDSDMEWQFEFVADAV